MKKSWIYIILTTLWIAFIFSFSLQTGEASSQVSSELGEWIVEEVLPVIVDDVEEIQPEQWEEFHFTLRKCAHFCEYLVLGILMNLTMSQMRKRYSRAWALAACALVASTDETIQRFVNGRSGQFSDVLLDNVGAVCGIGFVMLVGKLYRGHKKL